MIPNALLAQSLRRWKEDCAPVELKRYTRREWGAEPCFLHLHSGSKRQSSVRSVAVALFRMVQSSLNITRSRSMNEDKLPASETSINKSPEIPGSGIPIKDVSTEMTVPLNIGLGQRNHPTAAETASAVVFRKSENDEHH